MTDLEGGETIKVTCKSKSKGCKFSSKTYKNVKKPKSGTKSLSSLFGRKRLLKTGRQDRGADHGARQGRLVGDADDRQAQARPEDRARAYKSLR